MKNTPYSNAIGSIMYLMVSTRPDIAYAISCLSRYMSNPGPSHWDALKWLLRYLNGSNNYGITFSKDPQGASLVGYVDSNYANDRDNRKSTTSYVFTLCGACISWKSQLQNMLHYLQLKLNILPPLKLLKKPSGLKVYLKKLVF
ncbi:Retrovirus-related Pol polyprotein from transposon TNT 1-94 [Sesamum angolense]|uniref:Retrovirus-related Pol polyprotein from transposon TNT 1-94 n=1 Tax=Sesamum angolense TaxID=2727404 RepID=A0AAE2BI02_9LAMI|nr:Retrovirus-related Pol polyprotein from transposon TNT 1-94 [Sesamum angolense]